MVATFILIILRISLEFVHESYNMVATFTLIIMRISLEFAHESYDIVATFILIIMRISLEFAHESYNMVATFPLRKTSQAADRLCVACSRAICSELMPARRKFQ